MQARDITWELGGVLALIHSHPTCSLEVELGGNTNLSLFFVFLHVTAKACIEHSRLSIRAIQRSCALF